MRLGDNDSVDGADRAPDRYMKTGRETIDRIRDMAFRLAGGNIELADQLFAFHCEACALKYEDRSGAKGDPDADDRKGVWYRAMAAHVRSPETNDDPRAYRAGFAPYAYPGSR